MKRLCAVCLALLLCVSSAASAAEYPQYLSGFLYDPVRFTDTDGTLFVGLHDSYLATSSDFQNWTVRRDLPPALAQQRLEGQFTAVAIGYTLRSPDGVAFTRYENNLPETWVRNFISAGERLFLYSSDEAGGIRIYTTGDGIWWDVVEADLSTLVPIMGEYPTLTYYNGRYFLQYSSKLLLSSENGVSFTPLEAPGAHLTYYGGSYHTYEIDTRVLYSSPDLQSWSGAFVSEDFCYPFDHLIFEREGETVAYEEYIDYEEKLVYKDGVWRADAAFCTRCRDLRDLRLTEHGVFYTKNSNYSVFSPRDGGPDLTYDYRPSCGGAEIRFRDGVFYLIHSVSSKNYSRSTDGINWERVKTVPEDLSKPQSTGHNGAMQLETEYHSGGNRPDAVSQSVVTGTLTYLDGSTARVAYEYASHPYMDVKADPATGLFLLNDFCSPDRTYLSADGVTRFPCPGLLGERGAEGAIGNGLLLRWQSKDTLEVASAFPLKELIKPSIRVRLNGEFLSFVNPPVVEDGVTLIPVRFLFERAGARVNWVAGTTIIAYGEHAISFTENSATATVDGVPCELPLPVQLINGKTFIPLRFFSEQLGLSVDYDAAHHIAEITA